MGSIFLLPPVFSAWAAKAEEPVLTVKNSNGIASGFICFPSGQKHCRINRQKESYSLAICSTIRDLFDGLLNKIQ